MGEFDRGVISPLSVSKCGYARKFTHPFDAAGAPSKSNRTAPLPAVAQLLAHAI
jgi:hypothetical protein